MAKSKPKPLWLDQIDDDGVDPFNLPPKEAIAYFKRKGLSPTWHYADMQKEAHDEGFTVAKMLDVELLSDVKDAMQEAIDNGETKEDFAKKVFPLMEAKGWIGYKETIDPQTGDVVESELGTPRRIELIYRQNMATSYEAAHWQEYEDNKDDFPFLKYVATMDNRTRDEHAAWNGITLPVDDEFWDTHAPLNGWGCRCSLLPVQSDNGGKDAPEITYHEWENPRTGEVSQVPDGIDHGWDYNPGKGRMRQLETALREREDDGGFPPADLPEDEK